MYGSGGRVPGRMHQGAGEGGGRHGARGGVSTILSGVYGLLFKRSSSESSSSESTSGGSGSSKKVGRPLGVNFPPVNVKAPEPRMNSERAAMPSGDGETSQSIRQSPAWRGGWRGNLANGGETGETKKPDISLFRTKKKYHKL